MFLVTTANQSFWKLDEPILFLGNWCKVYSQKHAWSELLGDVLPYHGLDRDALYNDYKYAMDVYERNLVQLSKELNELHNLNHSLRYWRIVLGPWLSFFVGVLLDRYRSICVAENSGKVTNTWITPEFPEGYLSNDFFEFREKCLGDEYNHCLFSQVIKTSEKIPWEAKTTENFLDFGSKEVPSSQKNSFKWSAIRWLGAFSKFFPDSLQKVVAVQSYIKPMDLMSLQLSMGMAPCPYRPEIKITPMQVNREMRRKIKLDQPENRFESILQKCILSQIPKIYIEGYSSLAQRALEAYPKKNRVILTSIAYKCDEGFKFWAAAQVDRGVKLAITQHGGHVGDGRWSMDDDHEINIADRYFTWGWTRENENKTVPMPSSKLGSMATCIPDPNGSILCVTPSFPRYPGQMFSVPHGPLVLETYKFQEKFLQTVSPEVSEDLVFRLFQGYPGAIGWEERLRWNDSEVCPNIYQGKQPFFSHLEMSRLCVCFYNGTPFLETFSADYPTLLCWDPKYTELNESAHPYFGLLRQAGILHDGFESAASKLSKIYKNPLSWWESPEVQHAKNKFCDRFARVSSDWISQWKDELLKLTREQSESRSL